MKQLKKLMDSLRSALIGNITQKKSKKILAETGTLLLGILAFFTPVVYEYLVNISASAGIIIAITGSWILLVGYLGSIIITVFGVPKNITEIKEAIEDMKQKQEGN